jgi:uncharacterized membrane protein
MQRSFLEISMMLTTGHIGLAFTVMGCALMVLMASQFSQPFRVSNLFTLAFSAFFLGVFLTFFTFLAYGVCLDTFEMCSKTTSETIWLVALPLMLCPAMWLIGCFGFAFTRKS